MTESLGAQGHRTACVLVWTPCPPAPPPSLPPSAALQPGELHQPRPSPGPLRHTRPRGCSLAVKGQVSWASLTREGQGQDCGR